MKHGEIRAREGRGPISKARGREGRPNLKTKLCLCSARHKNAMTVIICAVSVLL